MISITGDLSVFVYSGLLLTNNDYRYFILLAFIVISGLVDAGLCGSMELVIKFECKIAFNLQIKHGPVGNDDNHWCGMDGFFIITIQKILKGIDIVLHNFSVYIKEGFSAHLH